MRRGLLGIVAVACGAVLAVAIAAEAGAQAPALPNAGFEDGDQGWTVASRGEATVAWDAKGADSPRAVRIAATGGEAVVHAPCSGVSWGAVVELSFRCLTERDSEALRVVADFVSDASALPRERPAWWGSVPADGKWHRVGVKLLLPPGPQGATLHLAIGAGGARGTALLDDVALTVADPVPPPTPPATPALPLGWKPEGTLDATTLEEGDEASYRAQVGPITLTLQAAGTTALGQTATLRATVSNQDRKSQDLTIGGDSSPALAIVPRTVSVPMGTARTLVRVQGLLPGDHWGAVTLQCGTTTARVPVHVQVSQAVPAFGESAPVAAPLSALGWPLREVVLSAEQLADPAATAQQLKALVAGRPETLVVHLAAPMAEEPLRVLVGEAADAVTGWGARWREAPAGPEAAAAAAELVEQTQVLARVVRESDADGWVLSPVFRWEANDPATPEGQLLRACLQAGMLQATDALALAAPELPCTGTTLLESLDGKWRDTAAAPWAAWEAALVPTGVDAVRRELGLDWKPMFVSGIRCGSTGDAALDALLAARATILAAWEDEEGATFVAPPPGTPWIGLTTGTDDSPAGRAVREVAAEVSGAGPVAPEEPDAAVSRRVGAPISFRAFGRGDEEIVCLWNNTSSPADVELRLDDNPAGLETLDIAYGGPTLIRREHVEPFRYQKAAVKRAERLEALTIAPLQVLCYRFRFATPALLGSRLKSVGLEPHPGQQGPTPLHDERPWWQVLQDRVKPKENPRERT